MFLLKHIKTSFIADVPARHVWLSEGKCTSQGNGWRTLRCQKWIWCVSHLRRNVQKDHRTIRLGNFPSFDDWISLSRKYAAFFLLVNSSTINRNWIDLDLILLTVWHRKRQDSIYVAVTCCLEMSVKLKDRPPLLGWRLNSWTQSLQTPDWVVTRCN